MQELYINYDEMEWQDAKGYPPGTKIKVLRKQGESQTFLLKLPARFDMESHSHIAAEQHIVLDGEYESNGKRYGRGTYRFIPAKANHGPFISNLGATVLVIWELM